jgi:hypothetical protein
MSEVTPPHLRGVYEKVFQSRGQRQRRGHSEYVYELGEWRLNGRNGRINLIINITSLCLYRFILDRRV